MCGLMAFVGDVPAQVRGAATRGAAARGPHSWGVAALVRGSWRAAYGLGPLVRVPFGKMLVAHSRLATSTATPGDAPAAAEGQPLVDGRLLVAHNGTLTEDEQEPWIAVPDSLSLLRGLSAGDSPAERLAATRAPQAAVWADGDALWCGRWDGGGVPAHPLWIADGDGWRAVSSGYFPGSTMLTAGGPVQLGALG